MAKLAAEGAGSMEISPAELETRRLQEEITAARKTNAELQKEWLSKQNELVAAQKLAASSVQTIEDTHTKLDVLQQKKYRLEREVVENTR